MPTIFRWVLWFVPIPDDIEEDKTNKQNVNNATADDVEWDFEAIEADGWSEETLGEWGVDTGVDFEGTKAVGEGLTEQLKNAEYVEKENYFVKKPFVVIFYDESQRVELSEKLGIEIKNDTYTYEQFG